MNTALTVVDSDSFEVMQRVAKAMVASGYFQDARDVAQATIKILAGAEMGLPPFASMTNIHIIQGRPALGANLIATLIKNDPRYDYRVLKLDDSECVLDFYEGGQKVGESRFTAADAKKAGTKNMERFPRNMLFARAISNGARWYTPGIFGGAPVYTPEELGATVDEEGNVIEGEVVQQPPAAISAPATWEDIAPAAPTNGNGKQTGNREADARAWLEGIRHKTLGDVAKAAAMSGRYAYPQAAIDELKGNPLVMERGIIPYAKKAVTDETALELFDWLTAGDADLDMPELADLDETQSDNGPAAQ